MSVKIRLARAGAKKAPYYHVVATDSRNPRDGKFIEAIGAYDPTHSPAKFEVNLERLGYWIRAGAQPTEMVAKLVKRHHPPATPAAKA
jgi:small subunit ribosomal protein S16